MVDLGSATSAAAGTMDFIITLLSYIPAFIDFVLKIIPLILGIIGWVVLHFDITVMLIEVLIIGMAFILTNLNKDTAGNPISLLSNWINLHFKLLAIAFLFIREIFHLIAQIIIALTTWIP